MLSYGSLNTEFIDFFEKSTINFTNDEDLYKNIILKTKSQLKNINIEDLINFTGKDLYILNFVLNSIENTEDFEKFKKNKEILYKEVQKKYFKNINANFNNIIKISCLSQFNIGIEINYCYDSI